MHQSKSIPLSFEGAPKRSSNMPRLRYVNRASILCYPIGYVIEYTSGYYVTSRSSFTRAHSEGALPTGVINNLLPDTTYHVRVAPKLGGNNRIGRFSDPPEAFLTPAIPFSGKSYCSFTTRSFDLLYKRVFFSQN